MTEKINMISVLGVRIMAERIVLRLSSSDQTSFVELSPDEARLCVQFLEDAIEAVENGSTVADDIETFLNSFRKNPTD